MKPKVGTNTQRPRLALRGSGSFAHQRIIYLHSKGRAAYNPHSRRLWQVLCAGQYNQAMK